MNHTLWWKRSALLTLALAGLLIILWVQMNQYQPESQLTSKAAVDEFLVENWVEKHPQQNADSFVELKTGIFIQSLHFLDSSQVHVTGYIWQKYANTPEHIEIKNGIGMDRAGFILPEQVDQTTPTEIYRKRFLLGKEVCENVIRGCPESQVWDEELIGWYFEASLRQPFDYVNYPFDHKTVWVRMWANDFSNNIVLVPDFDSYDATGLNDIFGIENDIVLGTWDREDTFFDYYLSSYTTNFGIQNYIGSNGFPELRYNFVVKRKFASAFIVYLLPLFLVSILLFSALLTVTAEEDTSSRHGFSTSDFIAAASALFFVVMLAHIQLRQEVGGTNIVYIEYFYILMYAILVLATANTYLFSAQAASKAKWLSTIHDNDGLIPKLAYWPVVLSSLVIITLLQIFA